MINIHLYPSQFLNESRILREARTLAGLELFERIDLVGTGGPRLAEEESVERNIRIRRFRVRRDDTGLIGKVADAVLWGRDVYREYRGSRVACINCHSVATLALGCALKNATGARLIYDAHELETETSGLRGIRKLGTKLLERALIGHADYSIFVGLAINNWYRDRYGLTNTAVVYNSPTFAEVEPSDYFREKFKIPDNVAIFLYQGVVSSARSVPKLIEAFSILERPAALVIMGYGDLVPWVEEKTRQRTNIFYHPAVAPEELLKYTGSADYGLSVIEPASLSYEYCMPNKLFEYLMARKPVLVSPSVEQKELVEQYRVGEVVPEVSVEALKEGVLRLLTKDRRDYLTGIDRVRMQYCWEQQEKVLRQVYLGSLGFSSRSCIVG